MKKIYNNFTVIILTSVFTFLLFQNSKAGNDDRSGQAGATELLINPWGRSSGWGFSNSSSIRGIESTYLNIAGLAFTPKTEVIYARTQWLKGFGVNINSFGISQHVGESGVLGLSLMTMSFGDIEITQVDLPEGGIGKFSPSLTNIGIAYSKAFSESIFGGFNIKIINEAISNAKATAVAIDAGIQYITGEQQQIKFGVSMKNVGTKLKFGGDGLDISGFFDETDPKRISVSQKSADYELPSLINIGASYDFLIFSGIDTTIANHRVTLAANFTSNSFTKDQYSVGLEYSLKNFLMLRGAYVFEKDILSSDNTTNIYTGPSAGLTIEVPLNKEKSTTLGIDYSYQVSNRLKGTNTFGVRINL
jgi:hypothetical protein